MLLSADRFETDVRGSAEPVLVDFYAAWCDPCRALAPTVEKLAREGYRVSKVDIEAHPELTQHYRVSSLPTLVILRGGEEVARLVGLQSERTLRAALDRARSAA